MSKPLRESGYYWIVYGGEHFIAKYFYTESSNKMDWSLPGRDDLFCDKEFDSIGSFVASLYPDKN